MLCDESGTFKNFSGGEFLFSEALRPFIPSEMFPDPLHNKLDKKVTIMNTKAYLVIVVLLSLLPSSAMAQDLNLSLVPPIQSAIDGSTVTFTATLDNTSSENIFLNSLTLNLPQEIGANFTGNTDDFYNTPVYLKPNQIWSGALFTIDIGPSTPAGEYDGSIGIFGGQTSSASLNLVSQTYTVKVVPYVSATPEPKGSVVWLIGSLSLIGCLLIARHRTGERLSI